MEFLGVFHRSWTRGIDRFMVGGSACTVSFWDHRLVAETTGGLPLRQVEGEHLKNPQS